jgi:uncharacterized protein (DUF1778 family)
MPKALIQLTVRVEPETYDAAQRAARAAGISLSAWLARAIRERADHEAPETQSPPEAPGAGGVVRR